MVNSLPVRGFGTPSPVDTSITGSTPSRPSAATGAAFRVLLDQLEDQATGLQQTSEQIEKPEELAQAVVRARESLTQAFSLRDQLLEAWRASRQPAPRE